MQQFRKLSIPYFNALILNASKFILFIFLLTSGNLQSQILFYEGFNGADGSTSGTANGVDWSSSCPSCLNGDYWETKSGVFEGKDTNGEAFWNTDDAIDISNCGNIEISLNIESQGTMEACGTGCNSADWVRLQYNIDGTGWQDPANSSMCSGPCAGINVIASDDVPSQVYSTGCIPANGSNLQIRISVQCWSSTEYWKIDDITVTCSSQSAGEDGVLNICSTSPITNLFDQLGGNPLGGGTWSGPSNLSNGDQGTFDPATMLGGTYTYTVGSAPCQETASVTVTNTAIGNAGDDNSIDFCRTDNPSNLFDLLNGNPDKNGTWTGPSPLTNGDLGTFDPQTMNAGEYVYSLGTAPCMNSASVIVGISQPIAQFTASPSITTTENTMVSFTNESINAVDYLWDFGDNSSLDNTVSPVHHFPNSEPGVYEVILTAFDANHCTDTFISTITITSPSLDYEIPNVFTPNGDFQNDHFKLINSESISDLEVVILNRWGNVVFESTDKDFKWNGKNKNTGVECADGSYFYKMIITNSIGQEKLEQGFIQLAR